MEQNSGNGRKMKLQPHRERLLHFLDGFNLSESRGLAESFRQPEPMDAESTSDLSFLTHANEERLRCR